MAKNTYKSSFNTMSDLEVIKALLRKDKEIGPELQSYKYNLNKAVVYDCKGYDIIGSTCNVDDPSRHFIVKNNHYRVYEFPVKGNNSGKLRMTGDFIAVFHNLDYGYWTFTSMKHRFLKDKYGNIVEKVHYHCIGEINIFVTNNRVSWKCITGEGKCCRGKKGKVFDSDNVRKELGYHTTNKVICKRYGIKYL